MLASTKHKHVDKPYAWVITACYYIQRGPRPTIGTVWMHVIYLVDVVHELVDIGTI